MERRRSRSHEVHLRLNDSEYQALERNRARCGLSQQTYLRKMCLKEQPKERPPMEFFQVLRDLEKIKEELYSIAAAAKKEGWIDRALYWQNIDRLDKVVSDLFRQVFS